MSTFDPRTENPISLPEACRLSWIRTRSGRPNVRTLYRWAARGKHGVRLETFRMGSEAYTSEQALLRFFIAAENDNAPVMTQERAQAVAAAKSELAAMGV